MLRRRYVSIVRSRQLRFEVYSNVSQENRLTRVVLADLPMSRTESSWHSESTRLVTPDDSFKEAVVHLEGTIVLVSENTSIASTHVEEETLHYLWLTDLRLANYKLRLYIL